MKAGGFEDVFTTVSILSGHCGDGRLLAMANGNL